MLLARTRLPSAHPPRLGEPPSIWIPSKELRCLPSLRDPLLFFSPNGPANNKNLVLGPKRLEEKSYSCGGPGGPIREANPQLGDPAALQIACLQTSLCPQAMESKLLIGGRNIMDHTNEQQKMLELKRQEIAEQVGLGLQVPGGTWPEGHVSGASGQKPSESRDPWNSAGTLRHAALGSMGLPAQGLSL